MISQNKLLSTFTAVALCGSAAFAQNTNSTNTVTTVNTQDMFRVSFSATCQSFDAARGRVVTTRLTERNIIAQAVGVSPSNRALTRNFALVYNAAEDSLQVVDANLQPIVDVMHFGGGAAIADGRQLDRFTLVFFPGQTNELGAETNVFGSAVITERTNQVGRTGVPSITGKLQFVLTDGNVLGMTNPFVLSSTGNTGITSNVSVTNTLSTNGTGTVTGTDNQGIFSNTLSGGRFVMTNSNIVFDASARICIGTFSTVRATAAATAPATSGGSGTNTVRTPTTTGGTNGATGITGTNGITGTTTGTGSVIGFNPVTGTTTVVPGNTIGTGTTGVVPGATGTVGTGTVGATTTPGMTGTTTTGTVNTGTGTVGVGTTTGSGVITTSGGTVGTGTTGVGTTTGTVTGTGTTTGTPIVVGP